MSSSDCDLYADNAEPLSKPLMLAVDDDPVVLAELAHALDSRYSGD